MRLWCARLRRTVNLLSPWDTPNRDVPSPGPPSCYERKSLYFSADTTKHIRNRGYLMRALLNFPEPVTSRHVNFRTRYRDLNLRSGVLIMKERRFQRGINCGHRNTLITMRWAKLRTTRSLSCITITGLSRCTGSTATRPTECIVVTR